MCLVNRVPPFRSYLDAAFRPHLLHDDTGILGRVDVVVVEVELVSGGFGESAGWTPPRWCVCVWSCWFRGLLCGREGPGLGLE